MTPRTSLLCASLLLSALLPTSPSAAEPSKQEDDSTLTRARQQYDRARELAIHGQFEEARKLMEDTWSIKKHWQIAGYLGYTESKTNRYRSAAEHSAYALRLCPQDAEPTQRQSVEGILNEAKAHVTTVHVRGAERGDTLWVDGASRDNSYLPDPVFVDPGSHTIELRRPDGASRKRAIVAEAGKSIELDLAPELAAKVAGAAQPNPAPASSTYPATYETSSRGWSPRTWTVVSEGALAAVALGVGVVFAVRAKSLESDGESAQAALGSSSACRTPSPQCTDLVSIYDDHDSAARWANVGFVAGGVLGVATVATLLLWPDRRAGTAPAGRLSFAPTAGTATGLTLRGAF